MKRPLCWEGKPDEPRPGCGGCYHSALNDRNHDSGVNSCERRHRHFYRSDGTPRDKPDPRPYARVNGTP